MNLFYHAMAVKGDNVTNRISVASNITAAGTSTEEQNGISVLSFDFLSFMTAIGINASITLLCLCLLVSCLIFATQRFLGRREERDKLCDIVMSRYWNDEDQIVNVIQTMRKMKDAVIFRDVTAFHVLGYKYRCDNDVYAGFHAHSIYTGLVKSAVEGVDIFAVLKKIEHLFDALILELPYVRSCPRRVTNTFGSTIYGLAQVTSLMWCDHKAHLVCHLVKYFVGRDGAETFERSLISDRELETMILSKIPYVGQLCLNGDHFVLKDVIILNEAKLDLKAKVRYIDMVLSRNGKILSLKEQAIIECYYAARDICLRNNIIQSKTHFPEMISKAGSPRKIDECVICLRHLVRLMCYGTNMKKMENDDSFYQFLMKLHDLLYSWVDAHAMLEVIERSRSNILLYLNGITVEQMLMDRERTKAKLEHIEKELCHFLCPVLAPLHLEKELKERLSSVVPKAASERLAPAESEVSVYTMAASTSSYMMKHSRMSPEHRLLTGEAGIHMQQKSIEQGSLVSRSSLYATAGSISSTSETSEVKPAALSPQRVEIIEASESEGECSETPV